MADGGIVPEILIAVSALPGAMVWRHNTGSGKLHGRQWIEFGCPGSGDIIGCYRGRAIAIECKSPTGRQSTPQKRFQAAWELAGGVYIVARSVEDAVEGLKNV